jgi:hypothetical protein
MAEICGVDASNPGSYEDVVEILVPLLQKRGLMWGDYTVRGGIYRENLYNTPGSSYLRDSHSRSKFKWSNVPKSETVVENGSIAKAKIIVPVYKVIVGA